MRILSVTSVCLSLLATSIVAQTLPTVDVTGASDSPVAGRLPGALIVSHYQSALDRAEYPKSRLKNREGRVGNNVYPASPDEALTIEGARTRNVYLMDADVQPFFAMRAYEDSLTGQGAEVAYFCRADSCGGTINRAGGLGGNRMSLAYYLWPDNRILDDQNSAGYCAQTGYISDQEYRLFHDPAKETTVSVHAYRLNPSQFSSCKTHFEGRVVVVVDVVSPNTKSLELSVVSSDQMQDEIAETGKIALYGILFDSGKDSLRTESTETISQIAALMQAERDLRLLIVGHTDSKGSFGYNQDLSERRAGSVVRALVNQHGIASSRLFPVGVSFASPVATNDTEDGRAQNRRVELVKF